VHDTLIMPIGPYRCCCSITARAIVVVFLLQEEALPPFTPDAAGFSAALPLQFSGHRGGGLEHALMWSSSSAFGLLGNCEWMWR